MQMKRILNYAATLLAGLAIASCSENESSDLSLGIGRDITVSTDGGVGVTDPNEVNRFFMRITDKSNPRYNYYSLMEKENGEWVSYPVEQNVFSKGSPQKLLWSSNSAEIEVTAIRPPAYLFIWEQDNYVSLGAIPQPTEDDVKEADWLYCTKTTYRHGDGDLQLAFKHLMSKIELEVTMATEFNEVPGTQTNPLQDIRLNGLNWVRYYFEEDSMVTTTTTVDDFAPCPVGYTPGNGTSQKAVAKYVFLTAPDNSSGDFNVTLKINDKTYTWTTPTPINFESNKAYRLPIKVGKDYITVGDIMVSDWNDGGAFDDGESNLPAASKWDGSIASSIPGEGTQTNPYVISTGAELAYLAQEINSGRTAFSGTSYFELANDINLDEKPWTPIGYAQSDLTGKAFYGVFDGKGHTIYGLNVDMIGQDKSAGLFGWLCGSIKNLNIVNGSVKGDTRVALLSGYATASYGGSPKITNCHISGKVTGQEYTAGIMGGGSYVDVTGCTVNANIDGGGRTGAICGETFKCNVKSCTVRGRVLGTWSVGGMFGVMFYETTATNCISYARVEAADWHSGSFAGYMEENCETNNCIAYGDVHSTCSNPRAGGFVGGMMTSKIYNSSFNGTLTVSGGESSGCFVGYDHGNNIVKGCTYDATKNTSSTVVYNEDSTSSYDITGIRN